MEKAVELAHKRKVRIYFVDIISGVFIKLGEKSYILVNKNMSEHKKKIVLAHELGHYALHRATPGANALYCRDKRLIDRIEDEADRFAGKLLSLLERKEQRERKNRPELDPEPLPAAAGVGREYAVTTAVSGMAA